MASFSDPAQPAGSDGGKQAGQQHTEQQQARELWQDAKDGARSMLDEQKHSAASGIHDLAAALRTSAKDLGGRNQATVARMAQSAAESLEQISGALQRRDLDGLVREAESYARRQPIVFFGAAVLAGFCAMRFVKSTSQTHR
jgi:hypothetical protein